MEQYDIVKLRLFNEDNYLYVSILKYIDSKVKVKCLRQPIYKLKTSKFANSLFDGYDHEYGYEEIELKYENDNHTFYVHEDMLVEVDRCELYEIIHYLIHTNFLSDKYSDINVRKMICSIAVGKLKDTNWNRK